MMDSRKVPSMNNTTKPLIHLEEMTKVFLTDEVETHALEAINLDIHRGDYAIISGPSGCGKSTLLSILGLLDTPTNGMYTLNGQLVTTLTMAERANTRNREIGFIFQDHCLLPQCSVLENVLVPTLVSKKDNKHFSGHARELIEQVGLGNRWDHRPDALSGGEKQRVAIARALICRPRLLLCDEPTGNLDAASANNVASLLTKLHQRQQDILIVVTHNPSLAKQFPIRFELSRATLNRNGA